MTLLVINPPVSVRVKSFLTNCIATLIMGNIVYISCYLPSFMLLTLFHDPLVTLSTYFISLVVIITALCFCFLMGTVMSSWCPKVNHTFVFIRCLFMIIIFTCIFAAVLMTVILVLLLLGSISNSQLLQAVLFSLPLSLISLHLLKPAV